MQTMLLSPLNCRCKNNNDHIIIILEIRILNVFNLFVVAFNRSNIDLVCWNKVFRH